MNNRRKLAIALGASALAAPFGSFAQQQGKVWRIGFLSSGPRPENMNAHRDYGSFLLGMHELGYVEGKNLLIEWRFAEGRSGLLPVLAAELVQLKVDVIVAGGSQATRAAQKATATIPIIMGTVGDPVGAGFVKSLARPSGNITGVSNMSEELRLKHLEMLLSMVPKLSRVAVLVNPNNPSHATILRNIQSAAHAVDVKIVSAEAQTPQEIENAFLLIVRGNAEAVIVAQDGYFFQQLRQISELVARNRLPAIFGRREFVDAGGLMSYGQNFQDRYRHAAIYVDKILKGARPGDLPVEQPTKFELIINGKTAKALGLKIPQSLQILADKIIE